MNDISFVGMYNDVLLEEAKANPEYRAPITGWRSSGLGSCMTGRYLERLGILPDKGFDERTLDVFAVGKAEEDYFLANLEKHPDNGLTFTLERQTELYDKDLNLSGHTDFIASFTDGRKYIGEVKSKHSKSFWYMSKKGEGAQLQHKMQLWAYLYMTGIEEGRIIYISKDDRCKLEYVVKLDDEMLRDLVLTELDILNRAWEEKLPPPVPYDKKDWRASYCRWHEQCVACPKYLTV